jgi:HSP20 family molecular chaperone IbpA
MIVRNGEPAVKPASQIRPSPSMGKEEEMEDPAIAVPTNPEIVIEPDKPAELVEEEVNLYDLIASRASYIFDCTGRIPGRDLDNWLKAEAEILHPLHIQVSETPEAITVRADVPGFKEKDLKIDVKPRGVTISGTRETRKESTNGKTIYSEACSDLIYRQVDLPAAVDVEKVKTTVKDGILELELPKAEPDNQNQVES